MYRAEKRSVCSLEMKVIYSLKGIYAPISGFYVLLLSCC